MNLRDRLSRYALPLFYVVVGVSGVRLFWNDVGAVENLAQALTVTGQAVFAVLALAVFLAWIIEPARLFAPAAGWAVATTLTAASAPATFGGEGAAVVLVTGLAFAVVAVGVLWLYRWALQATDPAVAEGPAVTGRPVVAGDPAVTRVPPAAGDPADDVVEEREV